MYLGVKSNAGLVSHHLASHKALADKASNYATAALPVYGIILDSIPVTLKEYFRLVFVEEKVSKIGNLMYTYCSRCKMFANDSARVLSETHHSESLLHHQLTWVKKSILKDEQVHHRAVKHWANGAALHVGMLIHIARLESRDRAPVAAWVSTYQTEYQDIIQKYRQHKLSVIDVMLLPILYLHEIHFLFKDTETAISVHLVNPDFSMNNYMNMFFGVQPFIKVNTIFEETSRNLGVLVKEKEKFKLG
ncbi:hypothetical protein HHUSO_G19016 [Huso huso]|uniref:Uncharacterized protein n=1 Tax=Huso huso TaxID=61971 RepID=A0ABR0Z4W0_HUSHU